MAAPPMTMGAKVLDRAERNELLRAVLERADPKARAAAVYYFVDEMSQEQAAKAAGCSVPTLRKRLRLFIKSARKVLRGIDRVGDLRRATGVTFPFPKIRAAVSN